MSQGRIVIPCDSAGRPANVGTRLWSSTETAWAGFPLEAYRLHDSVLIGAAFQSSTSIVMCISGAADMGVQVGARADRAVSDQGAIVICGRGLEYKEFDWTGGTEALFLGVDSATLGEECESLSTERTPLHHFLIRDRNINALMLNMAAEIREGCPSGAVYAQSLSAALAAYVRSHYARQDGAQGRRGKLSRAQSARVRDYVQAHLAEDISLKDLSSVAGLSPSHFSQLFRQTFECAPYQYVIRRRVAEAVRLLGETPLPISEITQLTGFADQSHLTTMFRRMMHTTPKRYQMMYRPA